MAQTHTGLVKSLIGNHRDQTVATQSLGLHKIGGCTTQFDSPQTKGKVAKIIHLAEVSKA